MQEGTPARELEESKDTAVIDPHGASEGEEQAPEITVASLLQTEDEQEQVEFIQKVLQTKPATLTVSLSPITGNMTVIANRDLSYKQLHAMLDMASDAFHDQEKETLLANQARAIAMQQADKTAKEQKEAEPQAEEPEESEEAGEENEVNI